MKRTLLFLLILMALISCSKNNPIEATNTVTPDSTFAGFLRVRYYSPESDTLYIWVNYGIIVDGNYATLDTILSAQRDTITFDLYLSNRKKFHKLDCINEGGGNTATTIVLGAFLNINTYTDSLVMSDSTTTVDSLVVYYSYWRKYLHRFIKYGPYRNIHRNPPVEKYLLKS